MLKPIQGAATTRQGKSIAVPSAGGRTVSAGDGLPDQLSHVDDQIRSGLAWIARGADLAGADADRVVQPAVRLAVGEVKHRPDDLAAFWRVGPAVAVPLHHDHRSVVGLDDSPEVWPEGASLAFLTGEVRAAEPAGYR